MMVGLDGTIVAVANPAIQSHLHASLADIQWLTNAYLLTPAQLTEVKSAVSVGQAPVPPGTPPQLARVITDLSHVTFVSGMHAAFLVGAVVAPAGAVIALLVRRGNGATEPHAAI